MDILDFLDILLKPPIFHHLRSDLKVLFMRSKVIWEVTLDMVYGDQM